MPETDILNDILTSDPNEPTPKGAVLLFRMEVKSEFKTINLKLDHHDQRMDRLESDMGDMKHDMGEMKRDMSDMKRNIGEMQENIALLTRSLELVAQQVAVLITRK